MFEHPAFPWCKRPAYGKRCGTAQHGVFTEASAHQAGHGAVMPGGN